MTVLVSHVIMAGHALMGSTVTHAAVWMDMKEHIVRLVSLVIIIMIAYLTTL